MSGALDTAMALHSRQGQPAYVMFTTVAKELPQESRKEGRYIAADVDMVEVRQIGATDSVKFKVETWLKQNRIDVQGGRLSPEHAAAYEESYKRWKAGQDMPLTGTPIKSWPVITPAQVDMLVRLNIRTVEDLACVNSEGLSKIGMGAVDMQNKAKVWIATAQDKGKVTHDMVALQKKNDQLEAMVEKLTETVSTLQAEMKTAKKPAKGRKRDADDISASELMDE